MAAAALTYDEWVHRATATETVPPNSDGLLHVGERAALVEQLSYLQKRNAQLMKQQRAVLLAACEAQAAHAQCADFAGQLMRQQVQSEAAQLEARRADEAPTEAAPKEAPESPRGKHPLKLSCPALPGLRRRRPELEEPPAKDASAGEAAQLGDSLRRLERENAELLRKTAVLVDYVRTTAPLPPANAHPADDALDASDDEDSDDGARLPVRSQGCLPRPRRFDDFANEHLAKCKWDAFLDGVVLAFGADHSSGALDDE
ncbi:hypothetical protein M885DRAFT_587535 [Pelagophyceae sp. CCMP2097]|nr:hypothetical protein M885DRAFT_587535 [Pelagophyceae sp. CCMP2097]